MACGNTLLFSAFAPFKTRHTSVGGEHGERPGHVKDARSAPPSDERRQSDVVTVNGGRSRLESLNPVQTIWAKTWAAPIAYDMLWRLKSGRD
jgi:hypothetical protein